MNSLYAPVVDGERLLMVSMELVMSLFTLLFALPHVPSRILESKTEATTWFSVGTHSELRTSVLSLLRNSPIIQACQSPTGTPLTLEALFGSCAFSSPHDLSMTDPTALDEALDLHLFLDDVPITCQQMYHTICAAYRSLLFPSFDTRYMKVTREWIHRLYQDHALVGASLVDPRENAESQSEGLVGFCSRHTVNYIQPYFACQPFFYHPLGLTTACA